MSTRIYVDFVGGSDKPLPINKFARICVLPMSTDKGLTTISRDLYKGEYDDCIDQLILELENIRDKCRKQLG